MAIFNSSSYRLLNVTTVINILNSSAAQTTKYPHIRSRFYEVKKANNSRILLSVKSPYSSNLEKIYDDITKLFATDVLLGGNTVFTTGRKSNVEGIDFILTLQRATNTIEIFFKSQKETPPKLPELLQAGVLNEEYFAAKIDEQLQKLNEAKNAVNSPNLFSPNLNILLREGSYFSGTGKSYLISNVKKVERVGQILGKSDINITTKDNKKVKISLKKENFAFWSSAKDYGAAKKVLDYLVKQNIISISTVNGKTEFIEVSTGNKFKGIRLKATPNEIKKYCFGIGGNKVDYILIQTFFSKKFSKVKNVGGGEYNMRVFSKEIYTETANDIIRMMPNVYFCIFSGGEKSESKKLKPQYPGLDVKFITNSGSSRYYEPNIPGTVSLDRL